MKKGLLVIAFKYNDIFYAMSTKAYQDSVARDVLILSDAADKSSFPSLENFNNVISYEIPRDTLGQVKAAFVIIIKQLILRKYSDIIISNPYILIIQLLLLFARARITLVEDGVMNYYDFQAKKRNSYLYLCREKLLKWSGYYDGIYSTYLLQPDIARNFYGKKCHLNLSHCRAYIPDGVIDLMRGKKIFLGGGVYEGFSSERKDSILNGLAKELGFDLFVPHHASLKSGNETCIQVFNMNEYPITFEILMPMLQGVKIYSFGSSVIFNANAINPEIEVIYMRLSGSNSEIDELMMRSVSNVIELDVLAL